ncbi:GNAT family N-acetyltransferase [Streptomyces misionensis]|uniref:GNAT family N-acetyltransferase n=1 Tax=Streptomyces misionensis TaxID=67331 RepID=UPI0036FE9415
MRTDVRSFAVAHLLRRPAAHRVGPFVAGFDPATTSPYVNYATPVPGAEPTARDVAEPIAAFRARGLKPRLECAPDAAPGVEPALRRAGFATEAEHEYLVRTPATLTVPHSSPEPAADPKPMPRPRVRVEAPVPEADYIALDTAPAEAFGGAWAPSPKGAARLRRTAEGGGAVRLVRAPDGGCAGGALCSAPAEGTAELAGVKTLPAHRGRGVAAAVTASLAEALFARGARSVWLEYSGEGSRRVYERVGFRPGGNRLYLTLEE